MLLGNGLLYPVIGFASCVAFIYMSFGDLSFDLEFISFSGTKMSFVGRNGTQFVLDGKPFYVNGWNSYWMMDQAVEEFSRPRVRAMFQAAAQMGLTVCRTWAFNDGAYNALQVSLGQFDERVFQADVSSYQRADMFIADRVEIITEAYLKRVEQAKQGRSVYKRVEPG